MVRWIPMIMLLASCDTLDKVSELETEDFEDFLEDAPRRDRDECTVKFRVLQKDAYKETAGRSTELWPPHTTTEITAVCERKDGTKDRLSGFMANHGTEPDETDPNGDVFLEKMTQSSVVTTRKRTRALLDAYEDCECGTEFLTMDDIDDAVVENVVAELSQFIEDRLDCDGDPPIADLVGALLAGDIESVVNALPDCEWSGSKDLADGLDSAIVDALGGSLDDYHVCNNDAVIQVEFWEQFRTSGVVGTCDSAAAACTAPMWFYNP